MLCFLHKIALGVALRQLQDFFPLHGVRAEPAWKQHLRGWRPLHVRQLDAATTDWSSDMLKRSTCGLAHCYNVLPRSAVENPSVKFFQKALHKTLRNAHGSGARGLAKALLFWLAPPLETGSGQAFSVSWVSGLQIFGWTVQCMSHASFVAVAQLFPGLCVCVCAWVGGWLCVFVCCVRVCAV